MSIRRISSITPLLLAAAFFAVGCGSSDPLGTQTASVGGDESLETIDLEQSFGGLSFTDEDAAFGDDLLAKEAMEDDLAVLNEDEEDDVIADEPELRDAPNVHRTYLRVLWGQLDGRPEAFDRENLVDWGGSLKVTDGAIVGKRTILFERPYDRVLPRLDRQTLMWDSWTGPHMDGLLVCILSVPDDEGNLPGTVSFETGPLTQSFDIAALDGLEETIKVDELGNAVSFTAVTRDDLCPRGFLRGYWRNLPDTNGGVFRGHWVSANGRVAGQLMGRYGVTEDGRRVFAGKYISRSGRVQGLIEGSWESNDDGTGSFQGVWVNRFGNVQGVLGGETMTRDEGGAGHFKGRWMANCLSDQDPANGGEDGAL